MPTFSEAMQRTIPLLLDATWQAALLALCIAAVCRISRRYVPPAWRFALWGLVFARLALPALPGSPMGRLPGTASLIAWVNSPAVTPDPQPIQPEFTTLAVSQPLVPDAKSVPPDFPVESPEVTASSPAPPTSVTAPSSASIPQKPMDWRQIVGAIWLLGAAFVLCRQLVQRRRLHKLSASWSVVTEPELSALLDACRDELHVRQSVRLVTSEPPVGPALTGLISPTIVVPRSLIEQLSPEQLRMVLLHELCHIRRQDVLWDRLANLLLLVHWFNPAAWWARSQLRLEREQACDALVLRSSDRARQREYGRLVVELASRRPSNTWATVLVGAAGSPRRLKRRIDMIADYRDSNWKSSLLGALLLIVGVACGLTRADSKPQPAPESTDTQRVIAAADADEPDRAGDDQDADAHHVDQHPDEARSGAAQSETHESEAGHEVLVTSPVRKDVINTQSYVCLIRACKHIQIGALEGGYLEEVNIQEGQTVKKGDVMFKILPVLYKAKADAAAAECESAQIEYDNTNRLFEKGVVSDLALALVKAKLDGTRARLELAQAELNFADIKAPFDGIVDRLLHQAGSLIKEGDILTTMSDNDAMWVYFNVPEARYLEYMAQAKRDPQHPQRLQFPGARIELRLADGSIFNETAGDTVIVGAEFNSETDSIPFRADFPNPDHLLRPGQTDTILIHRKLNNVIVIPQQATFEVHARHYVYVVDKDNVVHKRAITVQNELDDIFVIKDGVDEGDRIVLQGIRQLHDGDKLEEFEFVDPQAAPGDLKDQGE